MKRYKRLAGSSAAIHYESLKKAQLLEMFMSSCQAHGTRYAQHPACWIRERQQIVAPERVGVFDIETTGLKADFAYIVSYAILDKITKRICGRVLRPSEIKGGHFDKDLVHEMCRDLKRYDRVVVHYGGDRRFDLPFSRTRCILHGADYPLYKEIMVRDTWVMAKNKLLLRSNRLGVLCEFFGIKAKGHPMTPAVWQRSSIGDPKALAWIWTHNCEDVRSTDKLDDKLLAYTASRKISI